MAGDGMKGRRKRSWNCKLMRICGS